ncbi:MAG: hypothetical protein ACRECA_01600, partial [Pseudolabrys sp.]
VTTPALAGSVTIPNTFSANTPAVAAQVNADFSAVATAVNGNAADIATLQSALQALQTQVASLSNTVSSQQTTISALTSHLAAVQSNSVLGLNGNLSFASVNGYPTAVFSGVNVQVINGMGTTNTTNGVGNLVIGYNAVDSGAIPFCSNGSFSDQTTCEANGGTWAAAQHTGSHNLIIGDDMGYSRYAGMIVGYANVINSPYSSASGTDNIASGAYSSVSGGSYSTASGTSSSVSGGSYNTASGFNSSVSGGIKNTASGGGSSVSGGYEVSEPTDYGWAAAGGYHFP